MLKEINKRHRRYQTQSQHLKGLYKLFIRAANNDAFTEDLRAQIEGNKKARKFKKGDLGSCFQEFIVEAQLSYDSFSYTNDMIFIYLFTMFEAFLQDSLKLVLLSHPECMISNRKLNVKDVLSQDSLHEVHNLILGKELDEFGHKSFNDQIQYLADRFNLDITKWSGEVDLLAQRRGIRNLMVHNQGKLTQEFKNNFPDFQYHLSDRIYLTPWQMLKTFQQTNSFIEFLANFWITKFK